MLGFLRYPQRSYKTAVGKTQILQISTFLLHPVALKLITLKALYMWVSPKLGPICTFPTHRSPDPKCQPLARGYTSSNLIISISIISLQTVKNSAATCFHHRQAGVYLTVIQYFRQNTNEEITTPSHKLLGLPNMHVARFSSALVQRRHCAACRGDSNLEL